MNLNIFTDTGYDNILEIFAQRMAAPWNLDFPVFLKQDMIALHTEFQVYGTSSSSFLWINPQIVNIFV